MSIDAGDALVRAIREHNPWWEHGADAFSLPAREKSDFYHLARPDEPESQFEDQPIQGLVGRRGVGKTTLLHQFIEHRLAAGDNPEQFLYLPFDSNPLYQLQSAEQLRRAVRHYESRVLGHVDADATHFVILDDVHRIEHPNKPTMDGWGVPVSEVLEGHDDRHVIVTASAAVQVDRELESAGVPDEEYRTQPILPEKFRDYIFTLYPTLEEGDDRLSPTSLREGPNSLPRALETGELDPFVAELRSKYDDIADDTGRIQSQVLDYLAMGGTISYDSDGVIESANELSAADYERLREDVRHALYQEVPGFESIQAIDDLERLCALAARNAASEPFRYQELAELFDVGRRTITGSYLQALEALYVLTGVTEYDNSRPRSVRLFLRDSGLVNALAAGGHDRVLKDFDREGDLARVAAFDHTMRFAYNLNAVQGREEWPEVAYWRAGAGEVDFVFEIDDTPVPIGLAYQPGDREQTLGAVEEFLDAYGAPLGLVLAGDTVNGSEPIEQLRNGVYQIPFWFYLMLC